MVSFADINICNIFFCIRFMPFIPTPENLKKYTDKIQDLLHEINSIELDEEKLKPKENQIIDEVSAN